MCGLAWNLPLFMPRIFAPPMNSNSPRLSRSAPGPRRPPPAPGVRLGVYSQAQRNDSQSGLLLQASMIQLLNMKNLITEVPSASRSFAIVMYSRQPALPSCISSHKSSHSASVHHSRRNMERGFLLKRPQSKYKYSSGIGDHSLRLINIHPPSYKEPSRIELELLTFPLAEAPTYTALSYTWNPPLPKDPPKYPDSDKVPIRLNGVEFLVVQNLIDALFQLRESFPTSSFWIDAICINQDDTAEKGKQVGIMDKIYQGASLVVIWLGKGGPGTRQVLETFRSIDKMPTEAYKEFVGDSYLTNPDSFIFEENAQDRLMQKHDVPELASGAWDAVLGFFKRRWFTRVWIIQEAVLARTSILPLGRHKLSWESVDSCYTIVTVAKIFPAVLTRQAIAESNRLGTVDAVARSPGRLTDNAAAMMKQVQMRGVAELAEFIDSPIRTINTAGAWYQQLVKNKSSPFLTSSPPGADEVDPMEIIVGLTGAEEASWSTILYWWLWVNKEVQATVDRDKVYGFLGILKAVWAAMGLPPPPIEPSYDGNQTLAHLLQRTAAAVINESKTLHILVNAPPLSPNKPELLPSWVPNLACATTDGYPCSHVLFKAAPPAFAAPSPRNLHVYEDEPPFCAVVGDRLRVRAYRLASVKRAAFVDPSRGIWDDWAQADAILSDAVPVGRHPDYYAHTGAPIREALWRTMILDQADGQRPAHQFLGTSFEHIVFVGIIAQAVQLFASAGGRQGGRGRAAVAEFLSGLRRDFSLLSADESASVEHKLMAAIDADAGGGPMDSSQSRVLGLMRIEREIATAYFRQLGAVIKAPVNRLFSTDVGHLGMGLEPLGPGDDVYIVAGCPVPLILRQHPTQPDSMVLVSVAYVHGVMFGEAVEEEWVWGERYIA